MSNESTRRARLSTVAHSLRQHQQQHQQQQQQQQQSTLYSPLDESNTLLFHHHHHHHQSTNSSTSRRVDTSPTAISSFDFDYGSTNNNVNHNTTILLPSVHGLTNHDHDNDNDIQTSSSSYNINMTNNDLNNMNNNNNDNNEPSLPISSTSTSTSTSISISSSSSPSSSPSSSSSSPRLNRRMRLRALRIHNNIMSALLILRRKYFDRFLICIYFTLLFGTAPTSVWLFIHYSSYAYFYLSHARFSHIVIQLINIVVLYLFVSSAFNLQALFTAIGLNPLIGNVFIAFCSGALLALECVDRVAVFMNEAHYDHHGFFVPGPTQHLNSTSNNTSTISPSLTSYYSYYYPSFSSSSSSSDSNALSKFSSANTTMSASNLIGGTNGNVGNGISPNSTLLLIMMYISLFALMLAIINCMHLMYYLMEYKRAAQRAREYMNSNGDVDDDDDEFIEIPHLRQRAQQSSLDVRLVQ